jgi:hypothetical protein
MRLVPCQVAAWHCSTIRHPTVYAKSNGFGNAECPVSPAGFAFCVLDHQHTWLTFKEASNRISAQGPYFAQLIW